MARKSSIEDHPHRNKIEFGLLHRQSIRRIAADTGASETSIRRYRDGPFAANLKLAQQVEAQILETEIREQAEEIGQVEAVKAISALEQIRSLQDRTIKLLDSVEAEDDRGSTLKAIREARGNIELTAKLTGEMEGEQVNVNTTVSLDIYSSPEWRKVGELLAEILPPELKGEVARTLYNLAKARK
jgi:hypothetical protein